LNANSDQSDGWQDVEKNDWIFHEAEVKLRHELPTWALPVQRKEHCQEGRI
jgi:hypothetical protein